MVLRRPGELTGDLFSIRSQSLRISGGCPGLEGGRVRFEWLASPKIMAGRSGAIDEPELHHEAWPALDCQV